MSQEPQILSREDLPVDKAKWVTLKKITWKDQDGKEVSSGKCCVCEREVKHIRFLARDFGRSQSARRAPKEV